MGILILLALLGGGAIIAKKLKASESRGKSSMSSTAPPNVYGSAADGSPNIVGSVGTVAQDNGGGFVNGTTAPLGTGDFRNPPTKVALTPAVRPQSHIVKQHYQLGPKSPLRSSARVAPTNVRAKGTLAVPSSGNELARITPRINRTAPVVKGGTVASASVTSSRTFTPAVATHPHPVVTKPHAPISPVHATGQLAAMHPEQDGPSHPLAASHGYAMHPANTPSGQRHISLQTR